MMMGSSIGTVAARATVKEGCHVAQLGWLDRPFRKHSPKNTLLNTVLSFLILVTLVSLNF